MQAFDMIPEDPVLNLCMGTAYLQHSCSRSVGDRNAGILKALAFFSRHACFSANRQEAAYNMGRAMHHLSLNNLAADWYERALVLGAGSPDGERLFFEAGHNLALIYEESGALALAHRVRRLYCSV
jgi:general transcription factor 3C polypeptide 3 (transcription factor C subunit 4)